MLTFKMMSLILVDYKDKTDNPMQGEWVMEVDWVKHEFRNN